MAKKRGPKYFFINKENLRISLDRISSLMEKIYEAFHEFKDFKTALGEDDYITLTGLESKAGLTDKLMEKLEKSVEKYRNLYMEQNLDILQTTIEDFVDSK